MKIVNRTVLDLNSTTFEGNWMHAPISTGAAIYFEGEEGSIAVNNTFLGHDDPSSSVITSVRPLQWSCPLGFYSPSTGEIGRGPGRDWNGCLEGCPPGTIGHRHDLERSTDCQRCPPGMYCNATGMAQGVLCPLGTYNPLGGGSSEEACLRCIPGSFSNQTGLTKCQACPPGAFTSHLGSQNCTPCPQGGFCPDPGASSFLVFQPCPVSRFCLLDSPRPAHAPSLAARRQCRKD